MLARFCGLVMVSTVVGLRFATTHGDGMVLPAAPEHATVWGFCAAGDTSVQVCVGEQCVDAGVVDDGSTFFATLPAIAPSYTPQRITASSPINKAALEGVLFGSVWLCSGQSNMDFTVAMSLNGTDEVQKANNYPHIRLLTVERGSSDVPLLEPNLTQPWVQASNLTIGGPLPFQGFGGWEGKIGNVAGGQGFSAVCWFFGRELQRRIDQPIGLIWTSFGGTVNQKWMPADALSQCGGHSTRNGGLWNAMIAPFLRNVISGVIWYQGESNYRGSRQYNCTFLAQIAGWRKAWRTATGGVAPNSLPFGFVQLSTKSDSTHQTVGGYGLPVFDSSYAGLRWAQTASYGVAPNPAMLNTFMATGVDIGQANSPAGGPHVQNKQDIGLRLVLAYRETVLGDVGMFTPGPIAEGASLDKDGSVVISFGNLPPQAFQSPLPTQLGFEISSGNDIWENASAVALIDHGTRVLLNPPVGVLPRQVRYLWAFTPCLPQPGLECPLRAAGGAMLPALPFLLNVSSRAQSDTMI